MRIFQLELVNTYKSTLKWILFLSIIIFLMLAFFPSMQSDSMKELTGAKLEGVDPALLEVLGLTELIDFTLITNYFGYVLQYLTLAVMVYVVNQSANSLIKEETDGTIEFLYSKPITRIEIFSQKLVANVISFTIMIMALFIVTVIGYILYSDYSLIESIEEVGIFYGGVLFVGFVFMAVGVLLSVIIKSSKRSTGVTMGIVFGTFLLGIIGIVVEDLSYLTYLSPMDWIKPQKLISEGLQTKEWIIGIATIIICCTSAMAIYKRKDLN